jgi:hypothetical protein
MENESDLPEDDGVEVEEDPQDDPADNAAGSKGDDDADDDGKNKAKKKPTAAKAGGGGAKKKYPPKKAGKTATKKKPDDMPRRPLSAYNYFFSEMRTKLLADRADGNDELFRDFMASEGKMEVVPKKNAFFANMGKFVAKRWKSLVRVSLSILREE